VHAIKDLTLQINHGEKVLLIGRGSSGKSSLANSIIRLHEVFSDNPIALSIDGVSIKEVGLRLLREKVTLISQLSPIISGSLRKNLDPCHTFADNDLWKALEEVGLKEYVERLPDRLSSHMSNVGHSVFSVTQKHLINFSRAILKGGKVIIIDGTFNTLLDEVRSELMRVLLRNYKDATWLVTSNKPFSMEKFDKMYCFRNDEIVGMPKQHTSFTVE